MLWCCRHPSIDMTRYTGEMGQDFTGHNLVNHLINEMSSTIFQLLF
jgi:hypothetical protein